jgi:hypothetical protein
VCAARAAEKSIRAALTAEMPPEDAPFFLGLAANVILVRCRTVGRNFRAPNVRSSVRGARASRNKTANMYAFEISL